MNSHSLDEVMEITGLTLSTNELRAYPETIPTLWLGLFSCHLAEPVGRVEVKRHTPEVQPIGCSPFPLGVSQEPNRKLGSSPGHFKPTVPISSNGLAQSPDSSNTAAC
jgi:hypothetical protein